MITLTIFILSISYITIEAPDGSFYAHIEYYPGTELVTKNFSLFTSKDQLLYSKSDSRLHTYYICNNGCVFAMDEYTLTLYDELGVEKILHTINYANNSGFSDDGESFFLSDKDGVFVYNQRGDLNYVLPPGRLYAAAFGGRYIAIVSATKLCYYEYGIKQYAIELTSPYVKSVDFTVDGEEITIEYTKHIEKIHRSTGARRIP